MILKVKVNMPKDTEELSNKVAKTMAEILVNKLPEEEIEKLIELLRRDDFNIIL